MCTLLCNLIKFKMEKPRKFTKKEILLHKQNGTLEELFNPDGSEIGGGIPKNLGDVVTVEPGDSIDKKATQAMNQQDKMGFIRTNNVLLRRESKFNETFLEEIKKLNEDQNKNTKRVNLNLSEIGLKHFKTTPTFNKLLYPNQITNLKVGDNKITVNHYIFSKLQQAQGILPNDISIEEDTIVEEVDILQPTQQDQPTTIETIQHNRPEVFLKVDTFVSDIQSFELTPQEQGVIVEYITSNLK